MLWAGTNPFNYPSGTLFRGDALKQELPFQERFGTPADIDLYLRTLRHGELIVLDEVGCEVIGHRAQFSTVAKQSGAFIDEMLVLLDSRRSLLSPMGIYDRFRSQLAASVLAHRLRTHTRSRLLPAGWPAFSPWQILVATVARCSVRVWWRLGLRRLPYLRRAG
jgi:hypothetical protein